MVTQQTLAAWLNFAKGAVDWEERIGVNKDGKPDIAFGELIVEVESILNDKHASLEDLKRAKRLAQAVNLHDAHNPECDTASGGGSTTGSRTHSSSRSRDDSRSDADSKSGTGSKSDSGTGRDSRSGTGSDTGSKDHSNGRDKGKKKDKNKGKGKKNGKK